MNIHEVLRSQIEQSRSSLQINRLDNLDGLDLSGNKLHINATLCPLYAQGDLANSQLLSTGEAITESRVAGKWAVLMGVTQSLARMASNYEMNTTLHLTFADRGVISSQPVNSSVLEWQKRALSTSSIFSVGRTTDQLDVDEVFTTRPRISRDN